MRKLLLTLSCLIFCLCFCFAEDEKEFKITPTQKQNNCSWTVGLPVNVNINSSTSVYYCYLYGDHYIAIINNTGSTDIKVSLSGDSQTWTTIEPGGHLTLIGDKPSNEACLLFFIEVIGGSGSATIVCNSQ